LLDTPTPRPSTRGTKALTLRERLIDAARALVDEVRPPSARRDSTRLHSRREQQFL
jgi:hypothetical protein